MSEQWQSSSNKNIYWRYDKKSKTANTLVYIGDHMHFLQEHQYWGLLPPKHGIIGRQIPRLKTICWIDTGILAEKCIVTGFKYRFYLLHGLTDNNNMHEQLHFKIEIAMPNQDEYTIVHESKYMTAEMRESIEPNEKIVKTYITDIDLELPMLSDKEQLASVKASFFHVDLWWKNGWLIEGFVLEPIMKELNQKPVNGSEQVHSV